MKQSEVLQILHDNHVKPKDLLFLISADTYDIIDMLNTKDESLEVLVELIKYNDDDFDDQIMIELLNFRYDKETTIICESDDRIIYVKRDEDRNILALNFTQGTDLDSFHAFKKNDERLLKFYNLFKPYKRYKEMNELQAMNEIMWLYLSLLSENMLA